MYIPRVSPADPQTKQRFFVGDVQAHLGDMDAAWGGGEEANFVKLQKCE